MAGDFNCSLRLIGIALPTVDNLRNFFLTPTTEMLSFFQHCEKRLNAWHDYVRDRRRWQNGANYKSVIGSTGLTVFVEKARKQTLYLVDIFVITNPLKIVNFFISTLQILRDLLRQNNERRVAVIFGMLA